MKLLWEIRDGQAVILRCDTQQQVVILPNELEGYPVTVVADYAFSTKRIAYAQARVAHLTQGTVQHEAEQLRCIKLPDTVREIGAYCFYGCRELVELHIGAALEVVGADAFMNCCALSQLFCSFALDYGRGLRAVLREYAGELVVVQTAPKRLQVLFPAYSEEYEEIPAPHTFHYHILGAGYEYRQCFEDTCFSFAQYDRAFECLLQAHDFLLASKVALYRLQSDSALTLKAAQGYARHLQEHYAELLLFLVGRRQTDALQSLLRLIVPDLQVLQAACTAAREQKATEVTALLLHELSHQRVQQEGLFEL